MAEETIFSKIIRGEIPADIVFKMILSLHFVIFHPKRLLIF